MEEVHDFIPRVHSPTHKSPVLPQRSLIGLALDMYNEDMTNGKKSPNDKNYPTGNITKPPVTPNDSFSESSRTEECSESLLFSRDTATSHQFGSQSSDTFDHQEDLFEESLEHHDSMQLARHRQSVLSDNEDEKHREEETDIHTQPTPYTSLPWGAVWEERQAEYRKIVKTVQKKREDTYTELVHAIKELEDLERQFQAVKIDHHTQMGTSYCALSRALFDRRARLLHNQSVISKSEGVSKDVATFPTEKVRVNVGGQIFETTLNTLRRDENSLLATMFSGRYRLVPHEDESFFIDRDPTNFRYVLNYLRDARVPASLLQDKNACQELLMEAKYYRLDGLVKLLQ